MGGTRRWMVRDEGVKRELEIEICSDGKTCIKLTNGYIDVSIRMYGDAKFLRSLSDFLADALNDMGEDE